MRTARSRTVANALSIGYEVRRCVQCSAGKSKNASSASRFNHHEQIELAFGCAMLGDVDVEVVDRL
jgi:hypothetical protein